MAKRQHPFIGRIARHRFKSAVESVEGCSAAEVMVAVRATSGEYRHIDFAVGATAAYAGLVFILAIPSIAFSLLQVLSAVPLLFVAGAGLSAVAPFLRRTFSGDARLGENTLRAARATFVKKGVMRTRERSGILVYVSLLEKRCVVLPDDGVIRAVGKAEWERAARAVEETVRTAGVGQAGASVLASAIEGLASLLQAALPRSQDDVNELPDMADEEAGNA